MDPLGSSAAACSGDSDDALIHRVLQGDSRAFEPLVRRHERRVFRVAIAVLGNTQDAEEAMQDAFIKAFRNLTQFRQEAKFSTWLTRIAVNSALNVREARKPVTSMDDLTETSQPFIPQNYKLWHDNPEKIFNRQQLREQMESAIRSLDPIYREAFILRDVEGMSAQEAASVLEISIPAMKSRLLRARLMIRETLAPSMERPPSLVHRFASGANQLRSVIGEKLFRTASKGR